MTREELAEEASAYNDHPRHETFKTKNKAMVKKVRVFDSYLTPMEQEQK